MPIMPNSTGAERRHRRHLAAARQPQGHGQEPRGRHRQPHRRCAARGVKADIAIVNGGGIRGNKEYPAGADITRRDVLSELPFGNRTVKLEVTGETILAALENGVSEAENAGGRFPQVSGLTFTADLREPKGQRISNVKIAGKPLEKTATYTLATNDYMFAGGDGYVMLETARPLLGVRDGS